MTAKHAKPKKKATMRLRMMVACIALLLCLAIAPTSSGAWLYHKPTAEVVTLTGHDLAIDITDVGNSDLIPGVAYDKRPYVTVPGSTTSIDSWVFIKVTIPSTLTCSVDSTWTLQETGYYYKAVTQSSNDQSFDVLSGDKITVKTSVTRDTAAQSFYVRACAVQRVGGLEDDRAAAFALAKVELDKS